MNGEVQRHSKVSRCAKGLRGQVHSGGGLAPWASSSTSRVLWYVLCSANTPNHLLQFPHLSIWASSRVLHNIPNTQPCCCCCIALSSVFLWEPGRDLLSSEISCVLGQSSSAQARMPEAANTAGAPQVGSVLSPTPAQGWTRDAARLTYACTKWEHFTEMGPPGTEGRSTGSADGYSALSFVKEEG